MSEERKLIGQESLEATIRLVNDQSYLSALSDDELQKMYTESKSTLNFYMILQNVVKVLCNSVYGGLGTPSLRYYNQELAGDITGEGRQHCKTMELTAQKYFKDVWPTDKDWIERLRAEFPDIMRDVTEPKPVIKDIVITADTDSNYVTFDLVFESLGLNPKTVDIKRAVDFIVFFMKNRLDPMYDKVLKSTIAKRNGHSTMIFELEAIGGFGIFAAKKKYVYANLWKDGKFVADKKQLKSTGIELKTRSAPLHIRKIMETFVNTIFVRKGDIDADTFFGMCRSVKEKLANASADELAKAVGMQKYWQYVIDDKETIKLGIKCPATVRGAATYNHLVYKNDLQATYPYLRPGMKAKLYYDTSGKPFCYPVDVDFPHMFAPPVSVDIQLEKLLFAPIKRLVDGLIQGNLNDMGSDKIQKGFSSMFNIKKTV